MSNHHSKQYSERRHTIQRHTIRRGRHRYHAHTQYAGQQTERLRTLPAGITPAGATLADATSADALSSHAVSSYISSAQTPSRHTSSLHTSAAHISTYASPHLSAPMPHTSPPPPPVRMSAHIASDPHTHVLVLWHIAQHLPHLRKWIVANPAADPELLEYIAQHPGPGVHQVFAVLFHEEQPKPDTAT